MKIVIGILIGVFPVLIFSAIIGGIAYLIYQRLEEKKKETFEKRDN
jgi:hypothetical protein